MQLDERHSLMRKLWVEELTNLTTNPNYYNSDEHTQLGNKIDALFMQCAECCDQCSELFCPYSEPLHGHHDGCSCCSFEPVYEDVEMRREARMQRWKTLLAKNTA